MYEFLSMISGIAWPAIPDARSSQLLAVQFQLEQSQWLSPDELRRHQMRQLELLVAHAYANFPFYRERFDQARSGLAKTDREEIWRRVPLLTRRDLQMVGDQLHYPDIAKRHGAVSSSFTSGSSGQPVLTLGTTVNRLFWTAISFRQHLWHHRDLRCKLATIRSARTETADDTKDSVHDNWGYATWGLVNTGPAVMLDVHTPLAEEADWLRGHDPEYLMTYPSVLTELAHWFLERGWTLPKLREARTFGEVLDPQTRVLCHQAFGVPIVDVYSCQELGYLALQCPKHEHYHVQSETVLLEVLDDEGRPCEPGQIGRVVVTSLHNFAMPLIRYDIGDFAEVGESCDCGRGLPVLKRILGRQRNMAILPDGRRVWPSIDVTEAAAQGKAPPIGQFQLVQRTLTEADLLLVTPRPLDESEEAIIRGWVDRAVGYKFKLTITYVDDIPRGGTGKYEDFRCEVDPREAALITGHD